MSQHHYRQALAPLGSVDGPECYAKPQRAPHSFIYVPHIYCAKQPELEIGRES